jgi:hypothetical protein
VVYTATTCFKELISCLQPLIVLDLFSFKTENMHRQCEYWLISCQDSIAISGNRAEIRANDSLNRKLGKKGLLQFYAPGIDNQK